MSLSIGDVCEKLASSSSKCNFTMSFNKVFFRQSGHVFEVLKQSIKIYYKQNNLKFKPLSIDSHILNEMYDHNVKMKYQIY